MIYVIYHSADFDGKFCCEIARKFLGDMVKDGKFCCEVARKFLRDGVKYIGWNHGDPEPAKEITPEDYLFMLDLSIPSLMDHPNLVWIDHHRTAIEKYPSTIKGYRIDGVAACRLTWQWFEWSGPNYEPPKFAIEDFVNRKVSEPRAVRLVGEYEVGDKSDLAAETFHIGLRSRVLSARDWDLMFSSDNCQSNFIVNFLLEDGKTIQQNASLVKYRSFDLKWEKLQWLCLNTARGNTLMFTAGIRPEHDGLLRFFWDGTKWIVHLWKVPEKPGLDISKIAAKHGGGGACGGRFECTRLPFRLADGKRSEVGK